jgi:protein SCO1/2
MTKKSVFTALLFGVFTLWFSASMAAMVELPRNSVYQLDVAVTDQEGHTTRWRDSAGSSSGPRMVSMFYTHCDYVCPMLFEAIRNIELQLPLAQRQRLQVGLITLDPARDDVAALKKTADQRGGDATRWRLYRTQSKDVRKLAGMLGVQYRQLNNGEFNHATLIILLDSQGVELARTDQIAKLDASFLKAVLKATEVSK